MKHAGVNFIIFDSFVQFAVFICQYLEELVSAIPMGLKCEVHVFPSASL
jgi:hypothetical protein